MNDSTINKCKVNNQISKKTFKMMHDIVGTLLSFPFSTRYNAKYGMKDLINALVFLCNGNSFAESGLQRMAVESDMKKTPSGSWLLDIIKKIPEQAMTLQLFDALDGTVQCMKDIGMFNEPITVAIDKHLIPRYDKKRNLSLIRSMAKKGTQKI